MRRFALLVAGLALLAGVAAAVSGGATQAQPRWVITDLGTLGGKWSSAYEINNKGQIIGQFDDKRSAGGLVGGAFLWDAGRMTDIGQGEAQSSGPVGINERGQVAVWSYYGNQSSRSFLWQEGQSIDLGTLPGRRSCDANAINERGQIVGSSGSHAFLWQNGQMIDLGTLPGRMKSGAVAINDRGQIAGWSGPHAVLWQKGKISDLGTLPGQTRSYAVAINERGQVLGNSYTPGGGIDAHAVLWQGGKIVDLGARDDWLSEPEINDRGQIALEHPAGQAVLWTRGEMRDLGTLGGRSRNYRGSYPADINNRGQIVGWSYTKSEKGHGFLWEKGRMTDLGTLPGAKESDANAINERGQVVGSSGNEHSQAVLWTLKR